KNSSAFTDYFVICSGKNPRQIQAIADEVELRLKREGVPANQVEGYNQADWVLLDYVDKHPIRLIVAFHLVGRNAFTFEAQLHFIGDGLDLSGIFAAADY